jgi:hypothetical protein
VVAQQGQEALALAAGGLPWQDQGLLLFSGGFALELCLRVTFLCIINNHACNKIKIYTLFK